MRAQNAFTTNEVPHEKPASLLLLAILRVQKAYQFDETFGTGNKRERVAKGPTLT
jgi:hypothetical protein